MKMNKRAEQLQRMQLADLLLEFPKEAQPPPSGWTRALRKSVGMSLEQLGKRLKMTPQGALRLEKAEADQTISLKNLARLAAGLNCRVVYALVPNAGTPEDMMRNRAEIMADALLKRTSHSMNLENQGLTKKQFERQRDLLINELLGNPRKLWQ